MRIPNLTRLALGAVVFAGFVLVATIPQTAAAKPPCYPECRPTAPAAWGAASGAVIGVITRQVEGTLATKINGLTTYLAQIANGLSNTQQNRLNSDITLADRLVAMDGANAVAATRAAMAGQIAPSRTACRQGSLAYHAAAMRGSASTATASREVNIAARFNNAAVSSQNGKLADANFRFKIRATKYCNPEVFGSSCSPSIGADRDLDVAQAIFTPNNLDETGYEVANDSLSNLIGDQVDDSLRGAALGRATGKTEHVRRQQGVARASLASSVMANMVERRKKDATTGHSTQSLLAEAAYFNPGSAATFAGNAAGEDGGKTQDNIAQSLAAINGQLMTLRGYFEQIAIIRAVGLAASVQQTRFNTSGVTGSQTTN